MQTLEYSTIRNSTTSIFINPDINYFRKLAGDKKFVVISSENIRKAYPELLQGLNTIIINDVESQKNLSTIETIIEKLLEFEIDRSAYIIGIGGGIVCDITGFVAHIFMRGMRFGLVPTTLLALADAAIGGKNGVNFGCNKNMIGSFDNPDFIVADSDFVQTLSEEQYMSGMGEVIKYALIGNDKILKTLTNDKKKVLARDRSTLQIIIAEAIKTKVNIVKQDPDDKGIRHILNFGHTIGHCIELTEGIPHGIAVVKGINAAIDISLKTGILSEKEAQSIKQLLTVFRYDISYHLGKKQLEALANDKKKENTHIRFVLLEGIGKPIIKDLTIDEIAGLTE
jgi:3-dehydroquinate synthetase